MISPPAIDGEKQPFRYAARQPILAANQRLFGYELLFRSDMRNYFQNSDPEDASCSVIDISSLHGFNVLCDNRLAFINCTRDILLEDYIYILPPERVVVEVLENVAPDAEVQKACRRLRASGYKIALDDFILNDRRECLIDLVDFIKVDLRQVPLEDAAKIAARYVKQQCKLLAEKVETWEDFTLSKKSGFRYFQGYFFRKPEMLRMRRVQSNRTIYKSLFLAVTRSEINWLEVEDVLKSDATLCYRLLRYLNSAAFGLRNEIRSVRLALVILGEDALCRWCRLAAVFEMTQNRPTDLVLSAVTRARFSELVGARVDHGNSDPFLLGLLSLMDSILEIPMQLVVDDLPIDNEIKNALLKQTGRLGAIYKLMMAVEIGAWDLVAKLCVQMQLPEEFVAESHWSAMAWAQTIAVGT